MKSYLASVMVPLVILLLSFQDINAQGREEIPFNDKWNFQGQSVSGLSIDELVSLPHSWNKFDAQEGIQYYRGSGKYVKSFDAIKAWSGKKIFIRFGGVNITAKVVINGQDVGEHKGGMQRFVLK